MASKLLSIDDAAALLGVVPQRVRALIADGRLPAQRLGRTYALDAEAVAAFSRARRPRGRPLRAANAWAILAELSGRADDEALAGRPPRSQARIEALIRQGGDAVADALARSQPRWQRHSWRVLPRDLDTLREDERLVRSGLCAESREIDVPYQPDRDGLDAYISSACLSAIRRQLQPIEESREPNLCLRIPLESEWILSALVAPGPVVAADLLDHPDPRVRRAAQSEFRRVAG